MAELEQLLTLASSRYSPTRYPAALDADVDSILWRHDVDFSLERAVRMAELEASCGIASTYFVDINSRFYNAHEAGQIQHVRYIVSLGHDVGVHLDALANDVSDLPSLELAVHRCRSAVEHIAGVNAVAFSFHNPTDAVLALDVHEVNGLVNAYSGRLRSLYGYCSDSNGYWRHRSLKAVLTEDHPARLQVLLHADWWTDESMSPYDRVLQAVNGRARANLEWYDSTLTSFNRTNLR